MKDYPHLPSGTLIEELDKYLELNVPLLPVGQDLVITTRWGDVRFKRPLTEADKLREILRDLAWCPSGKNCHSCGADRGDGHQTDCKLFHALNGRFK